MNWFKRFICKLFRINTYERLCEHYRKMYELTKNNYNLMLTVSDSYKAHLEEAEAKIEELNKLYEDPITYVQVQLSDAIEKYEKCANDLEELNNKQDQMWHKGYATGRSDAYAQMGIRALDARLAGNTLYMDEDGDIVEELNPKSLEDICRENEIEIDDLIDVM